MGLHFVEESDCHEQFAILHARWSGNHGRAFYRKVKAIVVSHTSPEQKLDFSHKVLNDWLQIVEGNVKVLLGQIETEDATKFRAKLDSIGPKNVTLSTGMFVHTNDI